MEMIQIEIVKPRAEQFDEIVSFLDSILPKEGYGFCNKMQVKTELERGSIWIAESMEKEIIGVRIGFKTIFNLAVHPDYRGQGIGKALIFAYEPDAIRVKSKPIGHLSKMQKECFVNPEPFYEKIGFVFSYLDYGRNFYQNTNGKAQYHTKGKEKHISVFRNKKQKTLDELK